ncbi:MAG: type IV pilus modification protein PilV [SAR86 cluster bacterium]|uniref:Type IV pilus modification protein PilV n=1 Tax=SAR86 cluster bacterium TaxID=2030880 RepID=A0A2A4MHV7_9GAMM|nr:MAG: type IV pilus modification protein PilV [SAR86 cluster bacterium]
MSLAQGSINKQKRHGGSTLIEILASLLIVSFGMLSIAGLQTVALKNNQSAYYRTQATMFASDMVERMRANIEGVENSAYDDVAGLATANCFLVAGCTGVQMGAQDVLDWEAAVSGSLPGGDAVVCVDSSFDDGTAALKACDGAGAVYAIKIWWDDNRDGVANQRLVLSFQPL